MALDTLPEEVRGKIFSYFNSEEVQLLRGVCRAWKYVIESTNQIGVVIHNDNYTWTLQSSNVFTARIVNFTKEFNDAIAFTQTIRRIEFHQIVVSYNLISLLAKCTLLEKLKFSHITSDCQGRIQCRERLMLPEVKTLQLNVNGRILLNRDEYVLVDFLQQIVFGKLEELIIRHDLQVSNNIEDFLRAIYERAAFDLPATIKSTSLVGLMVKNSQSLKRLIVNGDRLQPFGLPIEDYVGELGKLQFEEIVYEFKPASEVGGNDSLLIEGQTKLKRIDVSFEDSVWPAVIRAITASAVTLTYIKIEIGPKSDTMLNAISGNHNLPDSPPVDLSVLAGCVNLRTLALETFLNSVINMASLPDSIEILALRGSQSKTNLLDIPKKLTKLKRFELSGTIKTIIGGVTEVDLELFKAFIRITTLTYLKLTSPCVKHVEILDYCKHRPGIQARFTSPYYMLWFTPPPPGHPESGTLKCLIADDFDRSQI